MFVVTEAEAAAIRAAFDRGGELSAAIELRRLFPGVTDTAKARECAHTIAGWRPLPAKLSSVRLCPAKGRQPTRRPPPLPAPASAGGGAGAGGARLASPEMVEI